MRNSFSFLMQKCYYPLTPLAVILAMVLLFADWANPGPAAAQTPGSDCSNGIAVSNPNSNPGLVSDCQALLAARDTLAGTASLNWSADVNIERWDGIYVEGSQSRVVVLELTADFDKEGPALDGQIPPELGELTFLREIDFASWDEVCIDDEDEEECREIEEREHNRLTGPIPPELGNLPYLEHLSLFDNQLTGPIPPELGNLSNLEILWLDDNQLTGPIPPELGNLSNLEDLWLDSNQLTGPIPQNWATCPISRFCGSAAIDSQAQKRWRRSRPCCRV